jgi:hypothetical protein
MQIIENAQIRSENGQEQSGTVNGQERCERSEKVDALKNDHNVQDHGPKCSQNHGT